ncbi:hypothetical protein TNCV_2455391 [Trichonephila clavipes]|nr:hypothetical protein TNCV_2455391 [Trichonephila clavipes]
MAAEWLWSRTRDLRLKCGFESGRYYRLCLDGHIEFDATLSHLAAYANSMTLFASLKYCGILSSDITPTIDPTCEPDLEFHSRWKNGPPQERQSVEALDNRRVSPSSPFSFILKYSIG